VDNCDMPVIYKKAKVFIFPSMFEGFGIPIIEALSSKTPVITTKGGCFPEAGGPGSIYIDPLDEKELAEKIRQLLQSEQLRNDMAAQGFEYVQRFHPKVISTQMMEIYK
jgi:glycosyltransferase involved in cell wall biosynthesis